MQTKNKVCKMFVDKQITAKEFITEVDAKKKDSLKVNENKTNVVTTLVKDNKYLFIIGGIVIVIIGVATICVKIRKRRGSKL